MAPAPERAQRTGRRDDSSRISLLRAGILWVTCTSAANPYATRRRVRISAGVPVLSYAFTVMIHVPAWRREPSSGSAQIGAVPSQSVRDASFGGSTVKTKRVAL